MNYGKNLSSHQVFPGNPWEFTGTPPIDAREDKTFRDRWINDPKTEWNVFSLLEGVNPNCRIYADKEDDGNPPRKQYGVVVDYDAPATLQDVRNGMLRIGPHKPAWYGKSLSGHAHVLWLFEKPLNLPENINLVRRWLKFLRERIPFHLLLIGFETGAFDEPSRRFTNGAEWHQLSEYIIPAEIVQGWFVQFSSKDKWEEAKFSTTIPLDEAAKILSEKYPRFSDWPGEFVLGSQGPTFWVEGSASPKSAIVKEGGMFTFSAHAAKAFWPWEDRDMLGADFVNQYKARELGKAVEGIYWDEKNFWHKDGNGLWTTLNKDDTCRHLIESGVSNRRDPATRLSPLDKALNYVQRHQRICGAAPFVYRPETVLHINQEPYLNIARIKAMAPAPGDYSFDAKTLPFLYPFLTRIFSSHEQFEIFMAWWARTYQHAYKGRPRLGQCIFLCGPVNIGKTLWSRGIIAPTLGGFEDPAKFLSAGDNFGSQLFKVGVWCLDDNTSIADPSKRRFYTEMLKSLAANRHFQFHQKYKVPAMTEWLGRVIGTLNNDENSVRALPDIGRDNMDKVMFFRAANTPPFTFPSESEIETEVNKELPVLCAILLKWEIPPHVRSGETRYEIRAYHEPSLLTTAQQSSPLAAFDDILTDWRDEYFKSNPKKLIWEGSVIQLQKEILLDPTSEMAMRSYSLDAINRALSGLKSRGYPLELQDRNGKRVIRIPRPQHLAVPAQEISEIPPEKSNSKFNIE